MEGAGKRSEREKGEGRAIRRTKAEGGAEQRVGGLTVVNSLKGIVRGVKDPFPKILHSLSPGQFLSKRCLPGA